MTCVPLGGCSNGLSARSIAKKISKNFKKFMAGSVAISQEFAYNKDA